MFHSRCEETIKVLREELRHAHRTNDDLVAALAETKGVVVPRLSEQGGDVYYMDEAREIEMEENGTSPT